MKALKILNQFSSFKALNQQLEQYTKNQQTKLAGDVFELAVKLYLQTNPKYRTKLKNVWLGKQVPPKVKRLINYPDNDFGIDQIAETFNGEYWSIQAKFRSHIDSALTFGELSTFSALSFGHCNDIKLGIVSHTSMLPIKNRKKLGNVSELGLEKWSTIDQEIWDSIRSLAKGKTESLDPREKKDHQKDAVKNVKD